LGKDLCKTGCKRLSIKDRKPPKKRLALPNSREQSDIVLCKEIQGAFIRDQCSDIHSRGALPFPQIQNIAKKFKTTHPEFTEIGEIASEDGRKVMDHEKIVKMI
jgi:hypothetical protein